MWPRNKKTIVTHSGRFHADDAFAVSAIRMLPDFRCAKLIRTRDVSLFDKGDIVVDVGGTYDATRNHFDHHQTGGAGVRQNGIPYCGFGLFWKHYGEKICGSAEVAQIVDERLVQVVDATDNGMIVSKSTIKGYEEYTLDNMIQSFRASWQEKGTNEDKAFDEASSIAGKILAREIVFAKGKFLAKGKIESIYQNTIDKRLIIMDEYMPFGDVLRKYPEPLFVVFPHSVVGTWGAKAIEIEGLKYNYRRTFPKAWAGKRDNEMAKISGVDDAIFCHNNLFLAAAKSKEGAIKLAQLAIENKDN